MLRKRLLNGSSRGRIVAVLQRGGLTADEMASELGVTAAAVRAHLTAMERDGIVRRAGQRSGSTRPSQVFDLTPEVEQLLSGAYLPLLLELVRQAAARVTAKQFRELMRSTGRGLAVTLPRTVSDGPLAALTENHPGVCLAIESLIGALLKADVRECCDRTQRPQCCFHVAPPDVRRSR